MDSTELALVPVDEACHWLDRVGEDARRLVANLPHYTDDELLACREAAETLNKASWIVLCAADHEIMSRANRVSNRKEGDKTQTGIYATAVRQAKAVGVDPTTILRNSTIYANFGHILTGSQEPEHLFLVETLQDKGYWDAASHAPMGEMLNALMYFATQKADNPRFTVREAWRWINEQKAPPIDKLLPSIEENEALDAAMQYTKQAFDLLNKATGNRLRGQLKGYLEEIEWEMKLPPQSVAERLYDLINEGYDEVDIVKERSGWPRDWVVAWFKRMELEDWVRPFEKARVEGARGAARKGYVTTDKFKKALKELQGQGQDAAISVIPVAPDWFKVS
jgi:hypothetical protein